jgi:excisionase family DNA binding protein
LASVADCLGVKVRTVRQWLHDGKIKAYKPEGHKKWIVLGSEIRRLQGGNEN